MKAVIDQANAKNLNLNIAPVKTILKVIIVVLSIPTKLRGSANEKAANIATTH